MLKNTVHAAVVCAALLGAAAAPLCAEPLTNLVVMRTNNLAKQTQYHTIQFTTAKAGVIQSVDIEYQYPGIGAEIGGSRLIEVAGLGTGDYKVLSNLHATYTIPNAATNVPAGTKIALMLGDVKAASVGPGGVGCYGLYVKTLDANGTLDEGGIPSTGPNAICDAAVTAEQIATDAVGADELAGVTRLEFGTCIVNPGEIKDNRQLLVHTSCPLPLGFERVIAWPPADFQLGLVAKGSSVDCDKSDCHIDVMILNESSWGRTAVDAPPQGWSYIAFTR